MTLFKRVKGALAAHPEKVETLLENLGCEFLLYEQGGLLLTGRLPVRFQSDNKRSVQVRLNDSMAAHIRSRGFKGDIFSLVSYLMDETVDPKADVMNAVRYICTTCHLTHLLHERNTASDTPSDLDWLVSLRNQRKKRRTVIPNPVLPESLLDRYAPYPSWGWLQEGISYQTQHHYGVRFDLDTHRIVFPIRNKSGGLIGVKGRLIDDQDKEKGEPKYTYLVPCNISQEWFNFCYAQDAILAKKEVIVFEAEKSCMKLASHGIWNTLAISSSDITDVQAAMIKRLGMDIHVILAYDNDQPLDEVKKHAALFNGMRVSGIVDVHHLLDKKSAPIDKGLDVWNTLYTECLFPIGTP